MVAELLGGVVCLAGWELPLSPVCSWQGLQGTPSTSVTGGRLVSSPADRNALAQGSGDSTV